MVEKWSKNVVASQLGEQQPTPTPSTRAKNGVKRAGGIMAEKVATTSLPVDRLMVTSCNAATHAKMIYFSFSFHLIGLSYFQEAMNMFVISHRFPMSFKKIYRY